MSFTHEQVQAILDRDGRRCVRCGKGARLTPQHRANRGMGGSRARDVLSNGLALCWACNCALESDADMAAQALAAGWKIRGWASPDEIRGTPVFYPHAALPEWALLDDDGMRSWAPAPPAAWTRRGRAVVKIDHLLDEQTVRAAAAGFDPDTWTLARPGHDTDLDQQVSLEDARQALRAAGPLLLAAAAARLDDLLNQATPDQHRRLARRFLTRIS